MPASVAPAPPARPKPTGRPTDPLILGLEGTLEGLCACQDDRRAMLAGLDLIEQIGAQMAAIYHRQATGMIGHPGAATRHRSLRDLLERTVAHLRDRAHRLACAVIPELRSIATVVDAAITARREHVGPHA